MSLAHYDQQPSREWITLLPATAELAKAVAETDFVPKAMRGNVPAITACVLYGDEVGVLPMQALAHIAVIDGRPAMSSELMGALILRAGHELWIEEATNTKATVGGRRRDSEQISRVSWTMDDAKRANLVGKDNWRKYPRAMLVRRATAELARAIFADAIGGLAMIDELDDEATVLADSSGTTPEQAGTRRRRRPALAPVSDTAPSDVANAAERPPLPGESTGESEPPQSGEGVAAANDPAPSPVGVLGDDTEESQRIRRRLMATFREKGFTERDSRLAFARFVIGRSIESSNDLTHDEALRVVDALEAHDNPGRGSA